MSLNSVTPLHAISIRRLARPLSLSMDACQSLYRGKLAYKASTMTAIRSKAPDPPRFRTCQATTCCMSTLESMTQCRGYLEHPRGTHRVKRANMVQTGWKLPLDLVLLSWRHRLHGPRFPQSHLRHPHAGHVLHTLQKQASKKHRQGSTIELVREGELRHRSRGRTL